MRKAKITESECIGCTKCIEVCPVDAILGASKQMHVVLEDYCIGCKLCLPPCPVNCITLYDAVIPKEHAKVAKTRIKARKQRLSQLEQIKSKADQQSANNFSVTEILARTKQKKPFLWQDVHE